MAGSHRVETVATLHQNLLKVLVCVDGEIVMFIAVKLSGIKPLLFDS